jgi:peroxiredoxin
MFQWAKNLGVEKVKMLPDGNGDFSREMGMLVQKENLGFGSRSWRYSMHVVDGQIKAQFVEPGQMDECPTDPFTVSDAETMLAYVNK